jgi:mannose-6-phosphate isomerase
MGSTLYPLRFQPIFQRYIWGGHRLRTLLGKATGRDAAAESWEVCDHGPQQSIVRFGPLAGTSLHELLRRYGPDLLGHSGHADPSPPASLGSGDPRDRFPLLLKFLDAARTLSVQVHPNDRQAAELDPPDLGKTEAWVVLAANPGSLIYAGLQSAADRQTLLAAIRQGKCEEQLHRFEPAVGDCVFIPAGTVHALGAGLLVAEIQQTSNITFRLFDWNRLGADGRPRPLHVEEGLAVIDAAPANGAGRGWAAGRVRQVPAGPLAAFRPPPDWR